MENSSLYNSSERDDDTKYKVKRLLHKRMIILIFNLLKWLNVERLPASIPILTGSDFTKKPSTICYELMQMEMNEFICLC